MQLLVKDKKAFFELFYKEKFEDGDRTYDLEGNYVGGGRVRRSLLYAGQHGEQ